MSSATEKSVTQFVKETQDSIRDSIAKAARSADQRANDAIRGAIGVHMLELLGVEQDYNGKWRFREGTSWPLQERVRLAADSRLEELLRLMTAEPINFSSREMRDLRKEYRAAYLRELSARLQVLAREQVLDRTNVDLLSLLESTEDARTLVRGR